jgi:hypothetical protein
VRLGQFEQFIINGEVRIGRLTMLMIAMTDKGLDPLHVTALIDVFEARLRRWNENRLRLIDLSPLQCPLRVGPVTGGIG